MKKEIIREELPDGLTSRHLQENSNVRFAKTLDLGYFTVNTYF